jgi:hypothetical protein
MKLMRISAATLLTISMAVGVTHSPAEAATKKKKVVTTKRKTTTTTQVTLPPVLPPPPTTVAVVVDPNAAVAPPAPTVPPTTAFNNESIRQAFARMFAPRDIWRFDADIALSADAEEFRRSVNKSLRTEVYLAADARLMKTTADNRLVAIALALVADPKFIRPEVLQSSVQQASASFTEPKVLKVDGGVAIAGIDGRVGVALVAFENYFIEVTAVDRQRAIDAAFLISTNMGHQLTE